MIFTPDELKSLIDIIEIGTKVASQDKRLRESHAIQGMGLMFQDKLVQANEAQQPDIPVSE